MCMVATRSLVVSLSGSAGVALGHQRPDTNTLACSGRLTCELILLRAA
jgi:hypothetical protein